MLIAASWRLNGAMPLALVQISQLLLIIWGYCTEIQSETQELALELTAVWKWQASQRPPIESQQTCCLIKMTRPPPSNTSTHKRIFGMLTMLAFHWTGIGCFKSQPNWTQSPNMLPWRLKYKLRNAQEEGHHKSTDWNKNQRRMDMVNSKSKAMKDNMRCRGNGGNAAWGRKVKMKGERSWNKITVFLFNFKLH